MMKSIQQVKYAKDTEMYVHYPDFIWVCIASFLFGGISELSLRCRTGLTVDR
jgi:hypothetical protein